jgi:hypothetical protein
MTLENSIRLFAGFLVTISVTLGYFVSPYWFLFTAFVGVAPSPRGPFLLRSLVAKRCLATLKFRESHFPKHNHFLMGDSFQSRITGAGILDLKVEAISDCFVCQSYGV